MSKEYDLDALYLYDRYGFFEIGKIRKVNTKTINMGHINIPKDQFDKVAHKLTPEEEKIYKHELIKSFSGVSNKAKSITDKLKALLTVLQYNEFSAVDTSNLQQKVDEFTEMLSEYMLSEMQIGDEKLKISYYNNIEKVKKI